MNYSNEVDVRIGTCALCGQKEARLKESHSIPKFVYQWIKETSPTPYLRSSDNVNKREQDGPKEYLLCEKCEGNLSLMEDEFAEKAFKKIANYRGQAPEILVTETMRVCVLSIFWRTLLTSLSRNNNRTDEDKKVMNEFLASAKHQINKNVATTPIFWAPIYGDPPFYDLPPSMTYQLDRMVGAPDIRFFDDPHRYFAVFKLPFIFFFIFSEGWSDGEDDKNKFAGAVSLSDIKVIPDFLRDYIKFLNDQFEASKLDMSRYNLVKIEQEISESERTTGAHKSLARSQRPNKSGYA
ncbi:hypothetical protein [Vreelandella glaciei]|uniref:hypothetical protein n=1 Tax=Vreelandella glaciei TaxID=186761 RepID=UPI0030EC63CA|tara:strand:+ start:2141 stop:3025 length:885 start_codon:yes stop_codon:yes gene_type:complete